MTETMITVVGNLTAAPELRFTASGHAVANFTIASTPRQFDKQAGEWKDLEALFQRCQVWFQQAENVTETLGKGTRVVAYGRLRSRTFQNNQGQNRTVTEVHVDEIGPALRYATAAVSKAGRSQPAPEATGGDFGASPAPAGTPEPPF